GQHAAPRRLRAREPTQREDEEAGCEDVARVGDVLDESRVHFFGSRSLNILSMRSVIRKPLTMLVIEAATAMQPRIVLVRLSSSPAIRIDATIAIAEIAFVSDISGVCSSLETFCTTENPTKVESMKTSSIVQRLVSAAGTAWATWAASMGDLPASATAAKASRARGGGPQHRGGPGGGPASGPPAPGARPRRR